MTERKWEQFFNMVNEIVDGMPGFTWEEKAALVKERAKENEAESNFWEFVTWFNQ